MMPPPEISLRPATMDRTVDLPQPEWPISEMNSPRSMLRVKFSSTVSGPFGVGYTFFASKISTNFRSTGDAAASR